MAGELEHSQEVQPYDPEAYLLLVPFGGQLEPKINNELMKNGILVQRADMLPDGSIDLSELDLSKARGVILSGGNDSVHQAGARRIPQEILDLEVPKLGICYGQQALAHQLGGDVEPGELSEHGPTEVTLEDSPLFAGVSTTTLEVLMDHVDVVTELPDGFREIARSPAGIAGITNDADVYGVQFHPESNDTVGGTELLINFATNICGMQIEPGITKDSYRQRIADQQVTHIQNSLGDPDTRTIIFDSGGVDSAVANVLAANALAAVGAAHTITGIYVDNGLMRHEDGDTITVLNEMGYEVETQDWSDLFLHQPVPLPPAEAERRMQTHLPPLDTVTDPRLIRQIVKYGFMEVQRSNGQSLREIYKNAIMIALIQGTNLADKIESGDFGGDQIKEHHNSGIEEFVDRLIEPLSSLFKEDIRALALSLGLPEEIAYRQPFPGPGLALRVPANATGETIWQENIEAERRQLETLCRSIGNGALAGCWLPFRATGKRGDVRVHGPVVLLSGEYDPELIRELAYDIPSQTSATRVLYTEHEVDPDAVHSNRQMITEASLDPVRDAETAKNKVLARAGFTRHEVSQHYVASLPISLDASDAPTLMTRMFRTGGPSGTGVEDYLDGGVPLGGFNVDESRFRTLLSDIETIAADSGYGASLYDVTTKPPGTVELM